MLGAFEAFPTDSNKQYLQSQLSKYGFEHSVVGMPNFDSLLTLDAVSALIAKRNQRKADHLKKQQHRRGSFDSLLAGNGFGRSARSDPTLFPDTRNLQNRQSAEIEEKINRDLLEALISCMNAGEREHNHLPRVHQAGEAKQPLGAINREGGGGNPNTIHF
ncbi:uncharacterized protein [Atheta coriaria]|uniref:uncharacterized protein n=1 Tax=Dalotia coriaria TaxID=877792 RepID=UPI0031F3EA2B